MRLVREWKNRADDVVGTVHEGSVLRKETGRSCASYDFEGQDYFLPFRALVYCDATVKPVDGRTRCAFTQFFTTEAEAVNFVTGHVPLANTWVRRTLDESVARIEAWETRGAIKPSARARCTRIDRRLSGSVGNMASKCLLTGKDLQPGYTFDLLLAAHDWRTYGVLAVKHYQSMPNEWNEKDARKAVGHYQKLTAPDAPETLRRNAQQWVEWEEMGDPLALTFPPSP